MIAATVEEQLAKREDEEIAEAERRLQLAVHHKAIAESIKRWAEAPNPWLKWFAK